MMQSVIEKASAKINLSLHILGRRADGFHDLRSVVAFADVGDVLEITKAQRNELIVEGPFAADVPKGADNIIWKAHGHLAGLMEVPQVRVKVTKNLPVASGIGGGSADAAAMLRGLMRLAGRQVAGRFVEVSADVPVCFAGKPCVMTGVGEALHPVERALPKALVLVNPGVACSTAEVFKTMGLAVGQAHDGGTEFWRNDMTAAAVKVQPVIAEVLDALHKAGFAQARMSGSGATCFGVAENLAEAQSLADRMATAHPRWWVKAVRIGEGT